MLPPAADSPLDPGPLRGVLPFSVDVFLQQVLCLAVRGDGHASQLCPGLLRGVLPPAADCPLDPGPLQGVFPFPADVCLQQMVCLAVRGDGHASLLCPGLYEGCSRPQLTVHSVLYKVLSRSQQV